MFAACIRAIIVCIFTRREGTPHSSRLRRRRRQPLEELLPRPYFNTDLLEVVRVEDLRGREVVDLVLVDQMFKSLTTLSSRRPILRARMQHLDALRKL